MNRRLLTTMTAALSMVFLLAGPSPAAETCGFPPPNCMTADIRFEGKAIAVDNNCGRPILLETTVTDGRGGGLLRVYDGDHRLFGPLIDENAYYSEVSCCVGSLHSLDFPGPIVDGVFPDPVSSVIDFTCD